MMSSSLREGEVMEVKSETLTWSYDFWFEMSNMALIKCLFRILGYQRWEHYFSVTRRRTNILVTISRYFTG